MFQNKPVEYRTAVITQKHPRGLANIVKKCHRFVKKQQSRVERQWIRRKYKMCSVLQDAFLVVVAILCFVLCIYAFFYLNLSTELNLDVDSD